MNEIKQKQIIEKKDEEINRLNSAINILENERNQILKFEEIKSKENSTKDEYLNSIRKRKKQTIYKVLIILLLLIKKLTKKHIELKAQNYFLSQSFSQFLKFENLVNNFSKFEDRKLRLSNFTKLNKFRIHFYSIFFIIHLKIRISKKGKRNNEQNFSFDFSKILCKELYSKNFMKISFPEEKNNKLIKKMDNIFEIYLNEKSEFSTLNLTLEKLMNFNVFNKMKNSLYFFDIGGFEKYTEKIQNMYLEKDKLQYRLIKSNEKFKEITDIFEKKEKHLHILNSDLNQQVENLKEELNQRNNS